MNTELTYSYLKDKTMMRFTETWNYPWLWYISWKYCPYLVHYDKVHQISSLKKRKEKYISDLSLKASALFRYYDV